LKPIKEAGTLPAGFLAFAERVMSTFEHIIVESKGAVGLIRLNRPPQRSMISTPTRQSAAS
jgi:hypothetical protein